MGICYGKNFSEDEKPKVDNANLGSTDGQTTEEPSSVPAKDINEEAKPKAEKSKPPLPPKSPYRIWASPYRGSPFRSPFRSLNGTSPVNATTPGRTFKRPFPPPSPAKHIQAALAKRFGNLKLKEGTSPGHQGAEKPLDKVFGYSKNFNQKYELGQEVGRGHFGNTCKATIKKGDSKGLAVAVKIITKAKMTTAISIEDVKREVKILKALTGHDNLVKFYDACEDNTNVYIVMELCEGGELLDRILARGGKYNEEDAKVVLGQILNIVAFCHLQGVVHRDLKPENFLFTTKEENAQLKAIDFGLSDFVRPDQRLNDIVGSAYYVAPEVLHRSYSIEADIWSIGVIAYILLCGSRPFWARTESGIFRSVLKAAPNFEDVPWPSMSDEAKDFVKRLLMKDRHKRMTAAQALAHPWIRGQKSIPLDILVYRQVKLYLRSTPLRRAALKALAKTLSENDLYYLHSQFQLLEPSKHGRLSLENFKLALTKYATEAMKESRMFDLIQAIDALQFKKMDFEEFCAAACSFPQLESQENWDQQAQSAYEIFEKEANRVVVPEDLARELGMPPSLPARTVLHDWIRHTDGKLSFFGFTNLLRGTPPRSGVKPRGGK
ncbi:hypothetical protein KP509_1Z004900 [Ceratopteris richardii]|nr:hypothetical protein KP509_1Z004900 [Ceratopteris richardii]KAH6559516.1 hypothetical protein KP509_1Z004900 [Ceratopteris richardii]KAH6559519.1 hypothetical protein KP509_1Z004900 [Ceratopteris richardii]KAH6559521.1 hypothetical protein KP509_1Z004900 [Ceratopteris richardii]